LCGKNWQKLASNKEVCMNSINKTILLVDDDEIQLALLENMLKTEYAVVKKKSGGEALDYLYGGAVN
jgi:PleD family two-component response regulator